MSAIECIVMMIITIIIITLSVCLHSEPELKILAHNNLCGRLIGKQGAIIKGMMEETSTMISVSRYVQI